MLYIAFRPSSVFYVRIFHAVTLRAKNFTYNIYAEGMSAVAKKSLRWYNFNEISGKGALNKMDYSVTTEELYNRVIKKLSHNFGVTPDQATYEHFYKALVLIVRELMSEGRIEFMKKADDQGCKKVYYLCMEFLMGRSLKNTIYNLGLEKNVENMLKLFGIKIQCIYDQEPDAGLGNGGLGRLAACYLDALASGGYPAFGYSIRYEYGIFRQKLVDGWQTELPDFWLPGGEIWFEAHPEESIEVCFDGQVEESWNDGHHSVELKNCSPVTAVPYDMMVPGIDGKGISVLRLFAAKSHALDMQSFNDGDYMRAMQQNAMAEVISKVLYPADNHPEGKSLRLRQQYFLVSAALQDIVRRHLAEFGSLEGLNEKIAIHVNDTHPVLAIPELMRILLDECGYGWDDAWNLTKKTIAYTNHTVMAEALECWTVELMRQRLPRIFQIITEIDNRHRHDVYEKTQDADLVERTAIISGGIVKMANLALVGVHHVNGVSKLHSEILKKDVFSDFYNLDPGKFTNVTNGIAYRRWLCQANPELAEFIRELCGEGFEHDAGRLEGLMRYADDSSVKKRLAEIKYSNKKRLADYLLSECSVEVSPDTLFDIQIKRLHEYKRQHMNALHILTEYLKIKNGEAHDMLPRTYIFGAKAAPGYFLAKQIIRFIYSLQKLINADKQASELLKVVFVEDYRVTLAELLAPAAEVSEQISLAGTEASGTGNMKLMLNGAVTLGVEDGANIEIHEAVGDDNIVIFGMSAEEAAVMKRSGYDSAKYCYNNPSVKRAIDFIRSGALGGDFGEIVRLFIEHDTYMSLADFDDYDRAHERIADLYRNPQIWNRMSLVNIAKAGVFSADRAISEYANNIWDCRPVDFEK